MDDQDPKETNAHTGSARRRLGRNVRWLALAEICTKGSGLLAIAYLTRKLGAEGLGQYTLGLIWLEFISEIHGLSLEDIISRDVAQKPSLASRMLVSSLVTIALLTPLMAVGAYFANIAYSNVLGVSLLALFLASILRTPARMLLAFYTAEENLRPFSIWQSAEKLGLVLSVVVVLALGGGIAWIFWSLPIVYLLLFVPVLVSTMRRYGLAPVRGEDIGYLFRRGLEFTGLKFVSLLYGRIDVILVERLLDIEATGYYSGAKKLLDVLRSVPLLIAKGLYPVLSRKLTEGRHALGQVVTRFQKMMVLYSLPLVAGGVLLAYRIMTLLYGEGFDESARVFIPFVWVLLLSSVRRPPMIYLIAAHRQNRATVIMVCGVVLGIALSFALIPRLGIIGAVYAILVPEFLMAIVLFREIAREGVPVGWRSIVAGPLAATAAMTVVVFIGQTIPLIPLIALGALVYAAGLLLLGGLDAEERAWTRRTLGLGAKRGR